MLKISLTRRGNLKASTVKVSQISPLFHIIPKTAHTVTEGIEAPPAQPEIQVLKQCSKVTGNTSPTPDSEKGPQEIWKLLLLCLSSEPRVPLPPTPKPCLKHQPSLHKTPSKTKWASPLSNAPPLFVGVTSLDKQSPEGPSEEPQAAVQQARRRQRKWPTRYSDSEGRGRVWEVLQFLCWWLDVISLISATNTWKEKGEPGKTSAVQGPSC